MKKVINKWTKEEVDIVKNNTFQECIKLLPNRTPAAITFKRTTLRVSPRKLTPAEKAWKTRRKNENKESSKTYGSFKHFMRKADEVKQKNESSKNLKFVINGVNLELSSTAKNVVIGTNLIKIDF